MMKGPIAQFMYISAPRQRHLAEADFPRTLTLYRQPVFFRSAPRKGSVIFDAIVQAYVPRKLPGNFPP